MRLKDQLMHSLIHANYINVGIDDHHDQPENIEVINTTLSVPPLPAGPGVWDIAMPFNASVVLFAFRSPRIVETSQARAGVTGIATRNMLEAAAASIGGWTSITTASKVAFYSKPGGALNLSHKIFTGSGNYISLSDIWLAQTGPSTRVLRTQWTNYGFFYYTLDVRGEIQVLG